MAETLVWFDDFFLQKGLEVHQLETDELKVCLLDTEPTANADTVFADITGDDLSTANGYTAGGEVVANNTYTEAGAVGTLAGDEITWTASGAVGPFSWACLYNNTTANKNLICYWAATGAPVTLANTETYTWKPSNTASGGVIYTFQETA